MTSTTWNALTDEALDMIYSGKSDDEIISHLSDMFGWDEATIEAIVSNAHNLS